LAGRIQFGDRQRQQLHQRGTPGQALGDMRHQCKILRTGEHEAPHRTSGAGGIDVGLDPRQQGRHVLYLVDDRAVFPARQETARIAGGEFAFVRRFQRDVGLVGKGRAGQRGFAGLARSGEGDHRVAGANVVE
jgi:hypothetical protein